MMIHYDLELFWLVFGVLLLSFSGFWGVKRVRALLSGR